MGLNNPLKTIVYYFLIEEMIYFGYWDEFVMVSILVYMVRHWTGTTVNYDVKPLFVIIHQAIILYELSTLKGY